MNVNYCIRRARQVHGKRTAIVQDGPAITYREFADRVDRSARCLVGLGATKGDRIAVLMGNSAAYLDLYFSIPMLGALIVPMNTRWHPTEMAFTLNDAGASWLLVDERFVSAAIQFRNDCPHLKGVLFYGTGPCPESMTDFRTLTPKLDVEFEDPDENDLVGLFYTSGTTGGPKGAMLTHRNLYSNAVHSILPPSFIEQGSRFLHAAPMFHLADVSAILALTMSGACHAFLPSFEPETALRLTEKHRITCSVLVPAMINMMVHHPSFGNYDLSSLRRVNYGASPMPLALLRTAMEKLGCEFSQGYGMTELSPLATILYPEDHRLEVGFTAVNSAGKPICGVDVRVVDHHDLDVPTGSIGEVIVRGPNVMKGYWNRPEISAEVLRGGWMHTGDLGRFDDDGYLYILDRKKDMIKPGGENVYSPEVESVLCAHPSVLEAAVIGIPDPRLGEAIRAVIALKPGSVLTEQELIRWCRDRLTHFKCPTSVIFTDTLPKGGTGKVLKNVLRDHFGSMATMSKSQSVTT